MSLKTLQDCLCHLPPLAPYPPEGWRITPLAGLSNQSFRLQQGDQDLLLRLPGDRGLVDRDTEAHNLALAASLGLCPPLLYQQQGILLSHFIPQAQSLNPTALRDPQLLTRVAQQLRLLHTSGVAFQGRVSLDETLQYYRQQTPQVPAEADELLAACAPLLNAVTASTGTPVPCHLDPHPGNFLVAPQGRLYLLDWEYSALGDPCWDLATLAGEAALDDAGLATLLQAYRPGSSERALSRLWLYRGLLDLLAALWWYAYHPEAVHGAYPSRRLQRLRGLLASPALDRHLCACG